MTPTFRLGRIAGVQVSANWSVLVILALIVVGLVAGRLPLVAPGRSVLAYAAVGALSGLVFLASLLAHEVSHAVVARRNGIAVEGITLCCSAASRSCAGRRPVRAPTCASPVSGRW